MVKSNPVKKAAIGFGAAAASIYAAPELMASIETITFSPGSVAFTSSSSSAFQVAMGTVDGDIVGTFSQYNDSIGKTLTAPGLDSWTQVAAGQVLNGSTFSGEFSTLYFSASATGTVYIGFRATAANGAGVGWFSMDLGGLEGDIYYGTKGGQYGNEGESVTVGESGTSGDVPELGSAYGVGLLAMGAIGIRRRRREANK